MSRIVWNAIKFLWEPFVSLFSSVMSSATGNDVVVLHFRDRRALRKNFVFVYLGVQDSCHKTYVLDVFLSFFLESRPYQHLTEARLVLQGRLLKGFIRSFVNQWMLWIFRCCILLRGRVLKKYYVRKKIRCKIVEILLWKWSLPFFVAMRVLFQN